MNIGIIGIDTSHAPAFAKLIISNYPEHTIVGAWAGGCSSIPLSINRLAGFSQEIQAMDVPLFDSPEAVAKASDAILLLNLDGNSHLPLLERIARENLPVFIDKPLANTQEDANKIFELSKKLNCPFFSASALPFIPTFQSALYSFKDIAPLHLEITAPLKAVKGIPRYHFYGIHAVELVLTTLRSNNINVQKVYQPSESFHFISDCGNTALLKLHHNNNSGFNLTFVSNNKKLAIESLEKTKSLLYQGLLNKIIRFFENSVSPVCERHTLKGIDTLQKMNDGTH